MPSPLALASRPDADASAQLTAVSAPRRRLEHPAVLLFVIVAAQLMITLDATVVNVALPHIQQSLHFSSTGLSWVLNGYVLVFGGLLLLGARAGDLLGRRRTFLIGIGVFTVSSMFGGLATSSAVLLLARALQGLGGALAAPSALALLTVSFPEGPQRTRAIGLFTTAAAAGGAVGLVVGGFLTEWYSWRFVMFVNVPIGLFVLVLARLVLTETPIGHGRFDFAGAATSTLGMTGIVYALVEAGGVGWASAPTIVPLVLGLGLLGLFVHVEQRATHPIVPLRLLSHAGRNAANAARGLIYAGMYGTFFFLGQFLQDVRGDSPLRTGVSFLALPVSVFASSQLTSRVLTSRVGRRALISSGVSTVAAALVLATRLEASSGYSLVLPVLVLLGIGVGISFVALTSASLDGVRPEDAGAASGLVNVAQQIGAALGLAALVTVFGDVSRHTALTRGAATHPATRELLLHGLTASFSAAALLALVALVLVLRVVRTPLEPALSVVPDFELEA